MACCTSRGGYGTADQHDNQGRPTSSTKQSRNTDNHTQNRHDQRVSLTLRDRWLLLIILPEKQFTFGADEDQFPFTQPPAAGAAEVDAAGEAGVDFFSRGDCTWNLLGEAGDVDLNKGDFTWKGDPTVTEAINL